MAELFHAPLTRVHDMTKPNFPRSFSFLFACILNRESNSLSLFISGNALFKTINTVHIKKQNQAHFFTFPICVNADPTVFLNRLYSELFQPISVLDTFAWELPCINANQNSKLTRTPYTEVSLY